MNGWFWVGLAVLPTLGIAGYVGAYLAVLVRTKWNEWRPEKAKDVTDRVRVASFVMACPWVLVLRVPFGVTLVYRSFWSKAALEDELDLRSAIWTAYEARKEKNND